MRRSPPNCKQHKFHNSKTNAQSKSNVIISPHVSGITQGSDVPKLFFDNYERYIAGKDLKYVVDWDKGY